MPRSRTFEIAVVLAAALASTAPSLAAQGTQQVEARIVAPKAPTSS